MAKSKCFWQNRIPLTLWHFLQINPEQGGGVKTSSDQKNNATFTEKLLKIGTFVIMIKKNFSLKKNQKGVFVIFYGLEIHMIWPIKHRMFQNEGFLKIFSKINNRVN